MKRLVFLWPLAGLFFSCLSLSGNLYVYSSNSYLLTLEYSLRKEFIGLEYVADQSSAMVLPRNEEEWLAFAATHGGVTFQSEGFELIEGEERRVIRARISFNDPVVLEDLLSCKVAFEGNNPYKMTLTYERGEEPSETGVSYINGFCAGETVSLTIYGPGNASQSDSWSLRELLLETEAPSISIEWEE
ncbi:MAG: hypothetical protein PQJ59_01095 [Spirochaetales bacterium]|nr:hypothetical protein [Spirochaetales bacterium]